MITRAFFWWPESSEELVGSVTFHASNRTFELDGIEHVDSAVLAALITEIRPLL